MLFSGITVERTTGKTPGKTYEDVLKTAKDDPTLRFPQFWQKEMNYPIISP